MAVGQVVVRHDAIEPQLASARQDLVLAHARVHTQHHAVAFCLGALHHRHAHAVTIRQTARDVSLHFRSQRPQRCQQDHRRHRPVHVIVAVDENFLLPLDGLPETFDRRAHVGHQERVVKLGEGRIEKTLGRLGLREAAQHQQPRHQRRNAQLAREPRDSFGVNRANLPAHGSKNILTEDAARGKSKAIPQVWAADPGNGPAAHQCGAWPAGKRAGFGRQVSGAEKEGLGAGDEAAREKQKGRRREISLAA